MDICICLFMLELLINRSQMGQEEQEKGNTNPQVTGFSNRLMVVQLPTKEGQSLCHQHCTEPLACASGAQYPHVTIVCMEVFEVQEECPGKGTTGLLYSC